ncbi:MAG: SDR family oxidoreductase, partial [Parcubacteria group bacterium]|nr:SDR family oxidoreductase [Parcubacteria group bacterium]
LGTISADVFTPEGCEDVLQFADDMPGDAPDIFVSNPAFSVMKPILEMDRAEFVEVINATLTSHFYMAKLIAQRMVARNACGSIIFISSIYGTENRAGSVAYDTAKAGINQMTRVFARELASHRIRVNAVAPGATDTPGERKFATEERLRYDWSHLPWGRAARPEEIGNVVAFLASDLASYITGQVIGVNGGMDLCDFSYGRQMK